MRSKSPALRWAGSTRPARARTSRSRYWAGSWPRRRPSPPMCAADAASEPASSRERLHGLQGDQPDLHTGRASARRPGQWRVGAQDPRPGPGRLCCSTPIRPLPRPGHSAAANGPSLSALTCARSTSPMMSGCGGRPRSGTCSPWRVTRRSPERRRNGMTQRSGRSCSPWPAREPRISRCRKRCPLLDRDSRACWTRLSRTRRSR